MKLYIISFQSAEKVKPKFQTKRNAMQIFRISLGNQRFCQKILETISLALRLTKKSHYAKCKTSGTRTSSGKIFYSRSLYIFRVFSTISRIFPGHLEFQGFPRMDGHPALSPSSKLYNQFISPKEKYSMKNFSPYFG